MRCMTLFRMERLRSRSFEPAQPAGGHDANLLADVVPGAHDVDANMDDANGDADMDAIFGHVEGREGAPPIVVDGHGPVRRRAPRGGCGVAFPEGRLIFYGNSDEFVATCSIHACCKKARGVTA